MAIGAYTSAILVSLRDQEVRTPDLPGFWRVRSSTAAGDDRGRCPGCRLRCPSPRSRLSGLTAGLATFAVLSIVNIVARNGSRSRTALPVSPHSDDDDDLGALGWAMLAMAAAWAFSARASAPLANLARERGRRSLDRCRGARERSIPSSYRPSSWCRGALFGMFIGSFNPDAFFLNITFLMIVMLVIGRRAWPARWSGRSRSRPCRRFSAGSRRSIWASSRSGSRDCARSPCARDARHPHLPARRADRRTRDRLAIASAICQGVRRRADCYF